MKNLTKIVSIFLLLISFGTQAQMQQKIEIKIDPVGDAEINMEMTMTAAQWQNWIANIGNNPAALKREVERSMPGYFMDDFKLEKDDMNRSFQLNFNAYGLCKIDKRGKWSIDTDQKNAQITELTDHKFMLVSSPQNLGGNVQQSYIIEFPEEANNIKVDSDSYGQTIFKFKMENSGNQANIPRWSGLLLLLVGAGLGGFKLFN